MISYCKKNKKMIVVVLCFSILIFLQKILVFNIGYDTDQYLADISETRKTWLSSGRYMLAFVDFIIRKIGYNMHIFYLITAINVAISTILFLGFLNLLYKKDDFIRDILTAIILISSPIFLEQYYFSLQAIEVSFSIALMMLAYLQVYWWMVDGRRIYSATVILTLSCCFGFYQSNVVLFIVGVLIILLAINEEDTKKNINYITKCFVIWILSLCGYLIIKKIVLICLNIEKGEYLESQITWLTGSVAESCFMIAKSIGRVVFGLGHVLNLGYLVCIVLVIWKISKSGTIIKWKNFYLAALLIAPLLLNIVMASRLLIRSVLGVPFVCAFFFWYYYKENKKFFVLFMLIILSQLINGQLLIYSDNVRYTNDIKIAKKIYQDCNANKKSVIVFYGVERPENWGFSYKGQTFGHSFFEWSNGGPDADEIRIWYFMKLHGMKFELPNEEEVEIGKTINFSKDFPEKGYIVKKKGCYYVNLGK